ncbi:MAG: DUF3786 domain-containing protein [Candidatus Omnitrophica bacterium]|nr:DUF3786 domain-containing protein [Candidatus Omnitrophota bacterium]
MSYETAIVKAWDELLKLRPEINLTVRFLSDEYAVDTLNRRIVSVSCNVSAKDFLVILLLHYLIRRFNGIVPPSGEWLTFRELSGVEGYAAAFRKRAIEPLIRKYGRNPEGIFSAQERLTAKRLQETDAAAMVFEVFPGVPVLVKIWKADEEFGPDANIFFDRSITGIFCTEDIVVLAGLIAESL